ncbi:MAG: hypothetical protein FWF56_06355 [Firmicutes bacterium]|nr:hypothetical protein [Bacillota bacterium]
MNIDDLNQDTTEALSDQDITIAKCVSCGANIQFDPSSQMLKCEYCGAEVDFDKSRSTENISIENLARNHAQWDNDTSVYKCDNCGAVEIVSKTEIAKECSYCHSTSVVSLDSLSGVKPDSVLPFIIDKKTASQRVENWIKRKFFAPKKFKNSFSPEQLRGVYNPAFVFDSNTFSSYKGSLGKHYTVVVGSGKNRRTEVRTRWFRVSGPHYDRYDNIVIHASNQVEQHVMNKLSPFNVEQAQNYNDNYLHGFRANHYHKDGLSCWEDAKDIIYTETKKRIIRSLHRMYDFDVVGKFHVDTQCYNIGYNYVLLPIYVGHCSYNQNDYNYFVNGFSGKITGKLPFDTGKLFFLIGLGVAVIAGIWGLFNILPIMLGMGTK